METEGAGGVDAGPVPFQAAGPWTQRRFRVSKPALRPHAHCTQLQGSGPSPCPIQGAVSRLPCSVAVSVQGDHVGKHLPRDLPRPGCSADLSALALLFIFFLVLP